jgi:hypothetical protein
MTRIIILAAGESTRWNNYMGTPKHLVDVGNGVSLLHRTVNQFKVHGDVYITGPKNDKRYNLEGTTLYVPKKYENLYDTKKFLDNTNLWSEEEKTIILWGDCYFSDLAVYKIVNHNPKSWSMYGRFNKSNITGCPYGELFAFAFMPEKRLDIEIALYSLSVMKKYGKINRVGGWELYRKLSDAEDLDSHVRYKNFINIDDETEDFDYPHDYDMWVENVLKNSSISKIED